MNLISTENDQGSNRKYRSIPLKLPFSKVEMGIWLMLFLGAFIGHLKRYLPVQELFVTVVYDLLCFGLLAVILVKRIMRSRKLPYSKLTPSVLIFCFFTLTTIFNPVLASATQGLLGWRFLASGILLHFLGFYAFENINQIWRFLKVFWFTALVISLYGLLQLLRGYTAVELAWIQQLSATMMIAGTGRYRLMATLGSAVDLGFYLTLSISTLSIVLLFKRSAHNKWLLISLIVMVIALVFTFVRAAWFATFFAVFISVVYLFWHVKLLRLFFPLMFLIVVVSILSFPMIVTTIAPYLENPALNERVSSLANPLEDQSILARVRTWTGIWGIIDNNPLGLGVGSSGAASLRFTTTHSIVTTDNSYLKILLETGWVGLLLFLILLLTVFRYGLKFMLTLSGDLKTFAIAFTMIFIAFSTLLFFGEYIELNPCRNILWVLSGILFSLPRFQTTQTV